MRQNVPVVIVRNKMDTLVAEGGLGERSVDLERQVGWERSNEDVSFLYVNERTVP